MRPRRRLSWRQFCAAVEEAVASLPEPFFKYLENVVVDVHEEPSEEDLETPDDRSGDRDDELLMGLFIGVPLTKQDLDDPQQSIIKIFRRPIEQASRSRNALFRNIRATVIHELAHHFGFSEEQLEDFERAQRRLEAEDL